MEEKTLEAFSQLSKAEEFLEFLAIPFDFDRLQPIRLPVLKRFHQLKITIDEKEAISEQCRLGLYRDALSRSYQELSGDVNAVHQMFQATSACAGCQSQC